MIKSNLENFSYNCKNLDLFRKFYMKIVRTIDELKQNLKEFNGSVGYVPTMGALHRGHLSLIEESKKENDFSVVSIFVNPTQFLPGEDLKKYPKNEEADIRVCEVAKVDLLFLPSVDEIYTENETKIKANEKLSSILEGAFRPGHFDGVCQVLNKFFNLIKPNNAYFGKKDAQQIAVVKNMVNSFFLDVKINSCEIVREADGLALSSRNSYLDERQKLDALKLSRSLLKASNLIKKGESDSKQIIASMKEVLEPLKVDYVEIVDRNFKKLDKIELENTIILVAAFVDETRLIDNIWI